MIRLRVTPEELDVYALILTSPRYASTGGVNLEQSAFLEDHEAGNGVHFCYRRDLIHRARACLDLLFAIRPAKRFLPDNLAMPGHGH